MGFDIQPPKKERKRVPAQPRKGHWRDEEEDEDIREKPRKRRVGFRVFLFFLALGAFVLGAVALRAGMTFSAVSEHVSTFLGVEPSRLPLSNPREANRLDVLILGLRGENDPHGGLLTDTIMLASVDTEKQEAALISIPRDIYLEIPIIDEKAKINEAFVLGEEAEPNGGGLFLAKRAVERITGVNIDYAVAVDFQAFEEAVDLLGGIDVHVAKPLHEPTQWGGINFYVPAGVQHMDGQRALYYVRSRYSTSDFDRARRQQEVMLAMRDKAISLGFLGNPSKVISLLDVFGRHVRMDVPFDKIPELFAVARKIGGADPSRLVLDTGSGLLVSSRAEGSYVLQPAGGTFTTIHEKVQNIFEEPQSGDNEAAAATKDTIAE